MEELKAGIAAVAKDVFDVTVEPATTRPDEQFGDYATNVALQLAKQLGKNPREVAEQLADGLRATLGEEVREVSVAGPGFVNLRLSDGALWKTLERQPDLSLSGQKIVIETNNPNPFKDMHIGHAFNCILGDTIANLLEAGGADLHRVSYHGDVGLHVGKSMWAILEQIGHDPAKLDAIAETDRPQFMSKAYARGADAYDTDPAAKAAIDELAQQSFSLDDETYKQVYETCKAWSFAYFDQIFQRLGSQPTERRYLEREADAAGRQAVEAHLGTIFEKSDGAIIFPGEKYGSGLHTVVFITQRGNTLYSARDLGLIRLKTQDYQPDGSYIVTAVEQKDYFNTMLKAAELALPDLAINTRNIPTGTVKLSSGKMSSRKGTSVNIGWLIDAITKALIERGGPSAGTSQSVIGALRYQMLKVRIGSDVIIDINEAISLDGNSGPYLQYAHARARSILGKHQAASTNDQSSTNSQALMTELEAGERSLLRKISEYPEAVEKAVAELMPHHICTYLYELAQAFNRFYEHNRVIGHPRQPTRLRLVQAYVQTLQSGLTTLGIPAPDHM